MNINSSNVDALIKRIAADPSASYWLQGSLKSALQRDPVDAANDAEVLAAILNAKCNQIQGR